MKFPILNISLKNWNNEDLDYSLILLENDVIYTTDEYIYSNYLLNNKYIDSEGKIYRIIGKELPASWKKMFRFIPNFYKIKLIFEKTDDSLSVEDVKNYIRNNINKFNYIEDFEKEWLKIIENATTYEQVLQI